MDATREEQDIEILDEEQEHQPNNFNTDVKDEKMHNTGFSSKSFMPLE